TLEATPVASAKELKDQKTPKAKRIVVGTDVHLKSYQAARKIDNAAIGAVANFRSEAELLLYVQKQCEQAEVPSARFSSETDFCSFAILMAAQNEASIRFSSAPIPPVSAFEEMN